MTIKATFFHAGCPVCVSAEQEFTPLLDPTKVALESVHLGQDRQRLSEAEQVGVRSVPALVLDGAVFHINHGADLAALR